MFGDFDLGATLGSPVYINVRRLIAHPWALRRIGELLSDETRMLGGMLRPTIAPFELIAGVPMGGSARGDRVLPVQQCADDLRPPNQPDSVTWPRRLRDRLLPGTDRNSCRRPDDSGRVALRDGRFAALCRTDGQGCVRADRSRRGRGRTAATRRCDRTLTAHARGSAQLSCSREI